MADQGVAPYWGFWGEPKLLFQLWLDLVKYMLKSILIMETDHTIHLAEAYGEAFRAHIGQQSTCLGAHFRLQTQINGK